MYNPVHGINKKLRGYTLKVYVKIKILDGGFEVAAGTSDNFFSPNNCVMYREPQSTKKVRGRVEVFVLAEDSDNVISEASDSTIIEESVHNIRTL